MDHQKDRQSVSPERITLRFDQWLAIDEPLFFAQPDTPLAQHWRAIATTPSLTHHLTSVTLLRVDNDRLFKLNGWQRLQLWTNGELHPPSLITATIYDVSQAEFDSLQKSLYAQHLKNLAPHELICSLYQALGLSFSSERLNKGFITEALNIALRGKPRAQQDKRSIREKQEIDCKKAISIFKDELLVLDDLNLKPEIFLTGVLAAALIMLATDRNTLAFFRCLNNLEGQVSAEGLYDPVEALLVAIESYKNKRITQVRMQMELCGKTVKAISLWNQGTDSPKYWTKNALRVADYQPYIREMKRIKGIHEDRTL
jgi:hypothetical protein